MNLYFRLLKVLIALFWQKPLGIFEESRLHFRVWPGDLDVNLHMNNGRYLTLMDLGRTDMTGRIGLLRLMVKNKWRPVVAAQTIQFRRALQPFQRFELRTRFLTWRGEWLFLEQRFYTLDGKLAARRTSP